MSEAKEKEMIDRRTWEEFRNSKLLWFTNRLLHTFGWAIVANMEEDGTITEVFPARVRFRGFPSTSEEEGFRGLTHHMAENIDQLVEEVDE